MSYTIKKSDGAVLATIVDTTVDTTSTSLTIVGKFYVGYGQFQNENYVKLLENFANGTSPSSPLKGQLWFDSSANILNFFDGGAWKQINGSKSSATAPGTPSVGELWWDSVKSQLKVWSGAQWVTIGPAYTAASGISGAMVDTIWDTNNLVHTVVKLYVTDVVVAMVSKDAEFTPATTFTGFATIKPGMNLSNDISGAQFNGTSTNSLELNGLTSDKFIRRLGFNYHALG